MIEIMDRGDGHWFIFPAEPEFQEVLRTVHVLDVYSEPAWTNSRIIYGAIGDSLYE